MKHLILSVIFLFAFSLTKAQSGLQFSQVRFLNLSFPVVGLQNLGTVPAGKVWKLENVQHFNSSGYTLSACSFRYNSSSVNVPIPYQTSSTGTLSFMSNNSPIWWPAGTVIDVNTGGSGSTTLYFSIIEFTVVP